MKRSLFATAIATMATIVPGFLSAQTADLTTVTSARHRQGETSLTVHVEFALGRFTFGRTQRGGLYRTSLEYDANIFEPSETFDRQTSTLDLGIDGRDEHHTSINLRDLDDIHQELEVYVTPDVPTDIDLEFGIVRADIDFGGLRLQRAKVSTGASESHIEFSRPTLIPCEKLEVHVGAADFGVEGLGNSNCRSMDFEGTAGAFRLDFSGEWQHTGVTDVKIKIGFGTLRLFLPRHVGISVTLDRFLASFDQAGLIKRGNRYFSQDYEDQTTTINFEIDAAVGDIDIIWIN